MFASVRTYADPSLAAALAARRDEVRSAISVVPGFRAYYLVAAGNETVSVTVCDDQAGAEESNRVAAEWLRQNLPELGGGAAPTVSAGPVVIDA